MKKEVKVIFHIDLNAFYASVAIINEPYLKNKIFVVGGMSVSGRGVITTSSYPARKLGIKAGMSIREVTKIYPKVLIVPIDFPEYRKYSQIFFDFLSKYSDKILKGSIDEAYVDMTEMSKEKHPIELAKEIQTRLVNEHQLPVSIGIAPTLFLAKMASDMKKPLGITVLRKRDVVEKLFPLKIGDLFGIGIKTSPQLINEGIKTIGDFTKEENKDKILKIMSIDAYNGFIAHIFGKSTNIIDPSKYEIPKSISNETTLSTYIDNLDLILREVDILYETVYKRLKKQKMIARTVNIKLRDNDFNTITRSKTINDYTEDYYELKKNIEDLVLDNFNGEVIRLIGVGVSNIILKRDYEEDYNLFTYQRLLK